jgi:hypothetical protein
MAQPRKLADIDPLFADTTANANPVDSSAILDRLAEIDPMLVAPLGSTTTTTEKPKPKGRQPLAPVTGLTAGQEQAAVGGMGAVAGPIVQKGMEKLFPTQEMRTAEGIKNLQEQQRIKDALKAFQDEELLKLGIQPEAPVTPKTPTSGTKWYKNWAGGKKEIDGGVPKAAAQYQRSKGQGDITKGLTKKYGTDLFSGEPGQIKESLVDRLIREGKEAEAATKARAAAMPVAEAAAAKRLADATPGPMSKLASVAKAPLVGGALGGAGAGMSFYEAYQRYMNGDTSGAVLSALAGAGGLMTMVPGLQVPGLAIGLGATGAQYALDKYNEPAAPTANPMASPPPSVTPGSAR